MRYLIALTVALVVVAGCARPAGDPVNPAAAPAGNPAGADREALVYEQVLRRYLTSPSENSFPDTAFKTVYVLDRARPDAGDPHPQRGADAPIPPAVQSQVTAALASMAKVEFIADQDSVLDDPNGCARVKDGGILITLGTLQGDDSEVRVGINGFVACLGATWLTYVVAHSAGTGWKVTGTTGSMAIS